MPAAYPHQPVLLKEVIANLNIVPAGIYIDGTFGRGGHSLALLKKLDHNSRVIAIDKDPDAVQVGTIASKNDPRLKIFQGSFSSISAIAEKENIANKVNGILLDLGVSSPQVDNPERGFSFRREGPLDMRMDTTQGLTLLECLKNIKPEKLAEIIKIYGEEKFARKIARAIKNAVSANTLTTTTALAEVIAKAHPAWKKERHPATKTFQALRIFINQELEELKITLPKCIDILKPGGRLLVISFHSLEDRMTKKFIRREIQGNEDKYWQKLPLRQLDLNIRLRSVGKAIRPSASEINVNPRARSAILRIVEKIK